MTRFVATAVVVLSALLAGRANAQPTVEPPRLRGEIVPQYPEGETRDASVLLEIVVDAKGEVGEMKVVEGDEPFVSAARDAVGRQRFEPARRAGKAIAAKIRLSVTFTAPKLEPPPKPPSMPEPKKPTPPQIREVRVGGTRRAVSSPTEHRLGRAEMRLVPGAFGDPYRAIDIMPGVVPTISGFPYYYVRGAPPSAVGYFVDEVRVPYLFHFGLGPGVIQPAIIDEVALHPAAFPGRYGRYAGAIVAGKTRDPANELAGEGTVRVFDAGAYVEAPFAKGRATAGVGGRVAYTAPLFSLFAPDTSIEYRDYNARASYKIDDHWQASAFTFGAFDLASQVQRPNGGPPRDVVLFASEFHRLDLRLDRRDASGATSRVAVTIGFDRTRVEGSRFAQDVLASARARHGGPVRPDLDMELGLDTMIDRYSGDLPSVAASTTRDYADAVVLFSPRIDTVSGAWVSAMWHPALGEGKRFELTGTARADVFTSDGVTEVGPSPRVSMRVPIRKDIAFLGALGIGAQAPAFSIPVPAVGYRRLPGGLGYGYQKSAGVEVDLPLQITGRVVGFHHTYLKMRDLARSSGGLEPDEPQLVPNSPSQAYGLEVFVSRKLTSRIGGFLSYTLSRSQIGSSQFLEERVSPFDRTHLIQVGASLDLGRNWRVSSRFVAYRGWPDEGRNPVTRAPLGRLPTFVRVDARLEKRWSWRKSGHISAIFEMLNMTASQEVVGRRCDLDTCFDEKFGPVVVPSIGVEAAL